LVLVIIIGILTVVGPVLESRQRSPEAIARAYLRAVERGDVDEALETVDPAQRDALRERIALQAQNRYQIVSVVLGRPSVVDRAAELLDGGRLPPAWVIVTAQVTAKSGERWRSSSTAALIEREGRWYLAAPLFA
jgi:hypothetical protein